MDEFSLIDRYFNRRVSDKTIGIGDDAAVISIDVNEQMLTCVDTMVQEVHFLLDDDPYTLGYKLLAVNLSDVAAMGGEPKWATLSLTLPKINENWLKSFSDGLFDLAEKSGVQIVGGDTTSGNIIVLSLQLMGTVPKNQAVLRSGANVLDLIFVTGNLGGASFELSEKLADKTNTPIDTKILDYPPLNIENGKILQQFATAMIDISDGLYQDLSHLIKASGVGAILDVAKLPLNPKIKDHQDRYNYALSGGEDYQLLFTISKNDMPKLQACGIITTLIGKIIDGDEIQLINRPISLNNKGFNHFN